MSAQNLYVRLLPEKIRQLAAASVPASNANPAWAAIGTGLVNPSRILIIQNLTNQLVDISFDGSVDAGLAGNINVELPAGGQLVVDEATNRSKDSAASMAIGTKFWVQYPAAGVAPTTGNVNVSTFYGVTTP